MLQLSHLKLFTGVFFAAIILSACGGGGGGAAAPAAAPTDPVTCDTNQTLVNNECTDLYLSADVDFYITTEYSKSGALGGVNAAEAYANIQTLIDADSTLKQGGEGQIISIASDKGFNTTHQEFGTNGAAFDSIYDANLAIPPYTHSSTDKITDDTVYAADGRTTGGGGKCTIANCDGTQYAALIAGRKGGTETGAMHGIAYNAQLRGIITDNSATQIINSLSTGAGEANNVGADIIAMNHVWEDETENACYDRPFSAVSYTIVGAYQRPLGAKRVVYATSLISGMNDGNTTCDFSAGAINDTLTVTAGNANADANAELTAWKNAVTGDNKTIMVFGAGDNGLNSENGLISIGSKTYSAVAVIGAEETGLGDTPNPMNANIPAYRAAYPALYTESGTDGDFTSDRWLVVTALNADGTAILTSANGCGVAMSFCLSAPGDAVHSAGKSGVDTAQNSAYADVSGTKAASSTVAGALAVLKGAFPNATPEQLTRLVLETSDYIELATHDDAANRTQITMADGTSTRYINPVYGYGKLNLATATTPNIVSSYVTASNNESIGALWQDTKLTLSSHFGSNFESVTFGIGDAYGRHFITAAPQTSYAPVAVSLDDYMANMLGDDSQSQTLGTQAQLNYSNSGETWMNLEYISGKATTKIAFQDSYKISPLSDTGTTTILRANNIRPASSNIGMMDVDYKLGNALSLSSYLARGEYDTGYKFDELATDFDVNYKQSHLNIAIGNIREHGQFLGTNTSGAYALNAPSISRFTDVTYGHDIGKFNIYANYINYETDVDMLHDQFATIDGLQADQYQIGFTGKDLISKDDSLNVALITKLGVTDGALNQNTVLGYTADGAFNNASQSYDLAVGDRHQQFEITYQGKLYQNADKISAIRDNRFFTSIIVDSNLNHVEGLGQTEIIGGINVRY